MKERGKPLPQHPDPVTGPPGFVAAKGDKTNNRPHDAPGGRRPTRETVQLRIEECADMLAVQLLTVHEIYAAFWEKWSIRPNTVQRLYIPRARTWIRERTAMTKAQAQDLFMSVVLDVAKKGSNRERLLAMKLVKDVFGLDAPTRHELSGPGGGPLATRTDAPQLTTEQLRQLVAMDPGPEPGEAQQ